MVKKIFNCISTVLLAIIVILAILLVGVRIVGYTPFAVLSGSMLPKYAPGDLVYVKNVNKDNIKVGDAVTFLIDDDTVVTHRVVEIDKENRQLYTKGDANKDRDGNPVLFENIVGKVSFSIPKLGYLSDYVQTRSGRYAVIMAFCFIVLLFILPELFSKSDKKEKKQPEKTDEAEQTDT